ncbi:hypothetical protein RND81_03G073200 [Saponaria officinalis]|uniref:Uncharacterized protein n=1 Tax=Saponaria officinalis TaxID=3572 RepID=A0AAW1M475_SAPOF
MLDNSGTKHPENRIHLFDPVALINDRYGGGHRSPSLSSTSSKNVITKLRRPTKSYSNFEEVKTNEGNNMNDEIRFEVDKSCKNLEDEELEVCTPRLWNQMNSTISPSQNCRTNEIAKGRRELMDMVKDLPESFYELSLKDIVEQRAEMMGEIDYIQDSVVEEKPCLKGKEKEKKLGRSTSVENERVLLKTSVFPRIFGTKKKKQSFKRGSSSVAVKGGEKDWRRRKSCMSSESEESNGLSSKSGSGCSSGSSSCSSVSSNSNARRVNSFSTICCLFNGKKTNSKK